jgi:predicted LPLAT superfamily acyltransferase
MTKDDDLVKRLRDRAKQERLIQANNEAVAAALMGQRLLFDQGHRSPSNTYAVRLSLDHEKCARQDAELAADWDEAADHIEALTEARDTMGHLWAKEAAERQVALGRIDELEAKLAKAVEALLLARVHVANNEQGWSVGRASARSDLEIINATLAEIEGDKP